MIITVVGPEGTDMPALLSANLALLRRRAGRQVLLLDAAADLPCRAWALARAQDRTRLAAPEVAAFDGDGLGARIEHEAARRQDIVIDGGPCDGRAWRPALIAAHLALVPLAAREADPARRYRLAACLNAARMFNPGLRVLFVALRDVDVDVDALAAVRRYAAEVMAGHVAGTALDAAGLRVACAGACACDEPGTPACAALESLYAEVYGAVPRDTGALRTTPIHALP